MTARNYTDYDGTDIPRGMAWEMIYNRNQRVKEQNKRVLNTAIESVGFWYEMYKKRLDKYKKLKNSLIDINVVDKNGSP